MRAVILVALLMLITVSTSAGPVVVGSVAPETSCLASGPRPPSCPAHLVPVYNPFAYVYTKDMLLVMAALSIMTLAVSAMTDDESVVGTTYLLLSLGGLVLVPAAIVYDWIVLLG